MIKIEQQLLENLIDYIAERVCPAHQEESDDRCLDLECREAQEFYHKLVVLTQ